jgi:hypothetical protein
VNRARLPSNQHCAFESGRSFCRLFRRRRLAARGIAKVLLGVSVADFTIAGKLKGTPMSGRLRVVLVILSLAATVNCGGSSPSAPSTPSLTGTWVGTETDTVAGTGVLQSTVSQSGSTLSGTYSLTFPNPIFSNSGTLTGTVNGSNVSMTATPGSAAICPALDTATVNGAGTQITGTYVGVSTCNLTHQTGSFTVTKQ